jgi:predicted CxxxxCH...CXXCH cytochrome family protein
VRMSEVRCADVTCSAVSCMSTGEPHELVYAPLRRSAVGSG